jgi:ring-1,2-phenylacetyl-CoA epoxidase subunit PaaE
MDKTFLTSEAILLTFDIPENLLFEYDFLPGQYIILKTEINNEEVRRSYSICTIPNEHKLSVVVKAIEGGLFSTYIREGIEIGDYLEVGLPEGRFVYITRENISRNIFFIAAGSGITPIISIIKHILHNEQLSTITLIFANKKIEDVIFYNELKSLESEFFERLKVIYIFSRKVYSKYHFGRIDINFLNLLTHSGLKLKNFTEFYLCGPGEMVESLGAHLYSLGISRDIIRSELFNIAEMKIDTEEFFSEDINIEESRVEVVINQKSHFVTINKARNLLDSLLERELDVPYSCKKGICSSCVGKVILGTVNMTPTHLLMDIEVKNGFILSCMSIPTSEELIISYDEY